MSKKPAVTKPGCLFFDQKTIHLSRGIKIKLFQIHSRRVKAEMILDQERDGFFERGKEKNFWRKKN